MDNTTYDPDIVEAEIKELVDRIREYQQHIASLEARVDVEKSQLRALLEIQGSPYKDLEGFARIVGDTVRVSYDTQALDEWILLNPAERNWLKNYRKEITIHGGVQVR